MQDIRWKQRHAKYCKMLNVLKESLRDKALDDFTELELIGLAKSFELLWKLLKDYLEHEEIEIGLSSPKNILKASAVSGLFQQIGVDGDVLMQAHQTRNELVHIYDYDIFLAALTDVKKLFLAEMVKVDDYFRKLASNDE